MSYSRLERLLALAWSLPDAIRQPVTATGTIAGQQRREASPTAWALCVVCHGDRVVRDRFRREQPCGACLGAGRYRVDPYTEQPVSSADAPIVTSRARRVTCDRCDGTGLMPGRYVGRPGMVRCECCDGVGKLDAAPVGDERSGQAGERLAWVMGGDWALLDRAVQQLDRLDRRAFVAAFVHGGPAGSSAMRALDRVAVTLPARLRVPADVRVAYRDRARRAKLADQARGRRMGSQARRTRNLEARRLLAAGLPPVEVAARVGVSERHLRRIA